MSNQPNGHDSFSRNLQHAFIHAEKTGKPFVTGFLTPARLNKALQICAKASSLKIEGGRRNALRNRLVINDEWQECHVSCLQASFNPRIGTLRHSDVLGALMKSGLERDVIGDIAVSQDRIYVVSTPEIEEFIRLNVTRIGRQTVAFETMNHFEDFPEAQFENLRINVPSMRLDAIVGALAHTSRSKAKEMILQGSVKVNDEIVESIRPLCNNDTISVRRCGKFIIGEMAGTSRKDRLILNIQKYQ